MSRALFVQPPLVVGFAVGEVLRVALVVDQRAITRAGVAEHPGVAQIIEALRRASP